MIHTNIDPVTSTRPGDVSFLLGPGPAGAALLYKLLCLHPDVAYVSNLEHLLPWLPPSLTGRLRLERYGSKLRRWFPDREDVKRPLLERVKPVPVEAEVFYARCGLPLHPEPGYEPDSRVSARLRDRLSALRAASGASVVVSMPGAGSGLVAVLGRIFPQARYISLLPDACAAGDRVRLAARPGTGDDPEQTMPAIGLLPGWPVLPVRRGELVAEPVAQMGRVLEFLGLERRRDYEWALKALKLPDPGSASRSPGCSQPASVAAREGSERLARSGYAS